MNWIQENKFHAVFLGCVAVVAAVLVYLMVSARGRYEAALQTYKSQATQLENLQRKAPYPDTANLKLMESQSQEQKEAITALQKSLVANQIPMEGIREVQFQDRLKESVIRVTAKANEQGMELPKPSFYMGFSPYQSEPPRPEATALLNRDLKAIELVVMELIDSRVINLTKLERTPLPEEGVKSAPKTPTKNDKDKPEAPNPISKHTVELGFKCDQSSFRTFLNKLVSSKTQFFIPRQIEVKNENPKGPLRVDPSLPVVAVDPVVAPTNAQTPAPGGPTPPVTPAPAAIDMTYIVGEEKIEVTMHLEIVDFRGFSAK